jgi:L-lactate dehydrogenase (cytochrome)
VYGLGAGGQAGVANAIEILRKELDVTMALCGVKSIADIGPQVLAGAPDKELAIAVRQATRNAARDS